MNSPAVTVIIIVNNAQKHLRQALNSVLKQTLVNTEIICVDDSSSDQSPVILKEYSVKDRRIKIVKQPGTGKAACANAALEIASGKYTAFLNADSYYMPNALEEMFTRASLINADIVLCSAVRHNDLTKKTYPVNHILNSKFLPKTDVFSAEDMPGTIFQLAGPDPWSRLIKTEFIKINRLKFLHQRACTGFYFSYMALLRADRIACINRALIAYRKDLSHFCGPDEDRFCIFYAADALKKTMLELRCLSFYANSFYEKVSNVMAFEYSNINSRKAKNSFRKQAKEFLPASLYLDFLNITRGNKSFMQSVFSVTNRYSNGRRQKYLTVMGFEFKLSDKDA